MSLIDDAYEETILMNKIRVSDGRGGVETTWEEGATISVAYSFDTSSEARIAAKDGTTNRYTLSTKRNINLQYHDVVKRVRDGKYFRVTSDGDDNYTPNSASLDLRQVEAEEWSLTNG